MGKKADVKILEVNNIDIVGQRFNGYDLVHYINDNTNYQANQIVNLSQTKDNTSTYLYNNKSQFTFEQNLASIEYEKLSVHSQLSISDGFLENSTLFKETSLIHFHMYHNSHYSLQLLKRVSSQKPVVITFHDMWFLTGRCVQPFDCKKWEKGCNNCEYLNTLFPMHIDNCNELWNLKKDIFKNIDIDVVVASSHMSEAIKKRNIIPENRVHLIPFGIDLDLFYDNGEQQQIKERFNIPTENIVLFFRAQKEFKGTEYIVEALKEINSNNKITLLCCGELGLLDELQNYYQIIELGVINTKKMIECYRACDIFLMPSIGESFGFMAIEAMACSRPVIVFDNTSLPSVTFAPECGVLVPNKNSYELKKAVEFLIENNQERIQRGKLGRNYSEEFYNINTYNKKMIDLYSNVLQRKNKFFEPKHYEIDFNNEEAQKLLKKLKIITKDLFGIIPTSFKVLFNNLKMKTNINDNKIEFFNHNVQNIIEIYNNLLYNEVKKNNLLIFIIINKFKRKIRTFIFLLKNDRKKLLQTFKTKIRRVKDDNKS